MRCTLALLVSFAATFPALAQPVNLTEKLELGDRSAYVLELELKGNLLFTVDGAKQSVPLDAKATHRLAERIAVVTDGLPSTTLRLYDEATASTSVGSDKSRRTLSSDRNPVVARRTSDGLVCFSPSGPLSRDELDLVTDHFNTQCLPGLLPGKVVEVGNSWTLTEAAVRTACLFESTIKANLTGKLTAVKEGIATFEIAGTAEGLESGARIATTVAATGTFDAASQRIATLTWKQKDEREQGAINPASQIEATVKLKRENSPPERKELSDDALAAIPEGDLPRRLTDLRHADAKSRYWLLQAREWHATGQTDTHLVLRLVDRGEYVAQATISVWNKAEAGKHLSAEEFKKAVANAPGWTPGKTILDRELTVPAGRWLYQLRVEGMMQDVPVVQSFYLLASPLGDQIAVTVVCRAEKAKAIEGRDLDLVNGIEFGKR